MRLKCKFLTLEKVLADIEKEKIAINQSQLSKESIIECIESVAWRMPWVNTCLFKSLYAYKNMKKNGYDVFLKIGVKKNQGLLLAHAWIEDSSSKIVYSTEEITPESYEKLLSL